MSVTFPGPLNAAMGSLHDSGRPGTVAGGYGVVPAAPIDTDRKTPAPARLSPRDAERLMQAELLSAVRSLVESSTELASRLGRRGSINGVLDVWAGAFPAGNTITRTYEVTAGSLVVMNYSAGTTLIVQSGVAAGDTGAQAAGTGVQYVAPFQRLVMPLADRSFTITGLQTEKVAFQVFTGLQAFGVGLC